MTITRTIGDSEASGRSAFHKSQFIFVAQRVPQHENWQRCGFGCEKRPPNLGDETALPIWPGKLTPS